MARLAILFVFLYQASFLLHAEAHDHEIGETESQCAACTQYEEDEFAAVDAKTDAPLESRSEFSVTAEAPQRVAVFVPTYQTRAPPLS